jgi:signal transduction histidine kinase
MISIYFIIAFLIVIVLIILLKTYSYKKTIADMTTAIKKAQDSMFTTRVVVSNNDETGILASNINSLLSELEKAQETIDTYQADTSRHNEKMASIGEVATTVAHEIKNPLAGISGALQVLAEEFPDDSPRKEIANDILLEIERLDMAVKDLIFYAKPPEPVLSLTDLTELLHNITKAVATISQKQNVTISLESDNIPKIMIDPFQIEKALLNIVVHSLHAMQDGGRLTIAADDRHEDNTIEIRFYDTGAGMQKTELADVFKPRFSTRYLGSGLGLAISRNIVEHHRGRIDVDSELGRGSTFRVTLPVKG